MQSALYLGKLRHRRFSPRAHQFTCYVFMAFLDNEDPVSFFSCHKESGELAMILSEMNSALGEPHNCFLIFTPPGEQLVAHMNTLAGGFPEFKATRQLERRRSSTGVLLKILLGYPLMTLRATAAIHCEALRVCVKSVPVYKHRRKLARQGASISKGQLWG